MFWPQFFFHQFTFLAWTFINVFLSLLRKMSSVQRWNKIKCFFHMLTLSSEGIKPKKPKRVKDKRSTIQMHGKLCWNKKEKLSFLERETEREREPKDRLKVPMTECYPVSSKDLVFVFITSVWLYINGNIIVPILQTSMILFSRHVTPSRLSGDRILIYKWALLTTMVNC